MPWPLHSYQKVVVNKPIQTTLHSTVYVHLQISMSNPWSNFFWPKEKWLDLSKLPKLNLFKISKKAISQQITCWNRLQKVLEAIAWGFVPLTQTSNWPCIIAEKHCIILQCHLETLQNYVDFTSQYCLNRSNGCLQTILGGKVNITRKTVSWVLSLQSSLDSKINLN